MRKLKLYIASTLNGYIARSNGDIDWLEAIPAPTNSDYGYNDFYASIDTTIQGHATYAQVLGFNVPFPYADKTNYVLTRKKGLAPTEHVKFISEDPAGFVAALKKQAGKDIWLIGGGQANTLLFNAGLIDEVWVFTMPIVIPEGIPIFGGLPAEAQLQLIECTPYDTGVVSLKYRVIQAS